MKPDELHRHHLAHDPKGKGWRVDLESVASIRIAESSADAATKKAIALRLAVCWNVLEGIPTEALLEGVVGRCYDAARRVCAEIETLNLEELRLREPLGSLVAEFRAADKALASVTTEVDCDCSKKETS